MGAVSESFRPNAGRTRSSDVRATFETFDGRPITKARKLEIAWATLAPRAEAEVGDLWELTARMHGLAFAEGAVMIDCAPAGAIYSFPDGSILRVGRGQAVELR